MTTFALLVKYEILRAVRNRWFPTVSGLVLVLSCAALTVAARDHMELEAAHLELVQRAVAAKVGTKFLLGRSVEPGLRIVRPPSMAAVLVQGDERVLPATWDFGPEGPIEGAPYTSPIRRAEHVGVWDLDVLVRSFGCLIGILLGLHSVSSDRLSRWSQARCSIPIDRAMWPSARLVAGFSVVGSASVLWWICMDAWMSLSTDLTLRSKLWAIMPLAWMLISTFFALGACVGWLFSRPLQGLLTAAILWLMSSFLAPSTVSMFAELVSPTLTRASMERLRATVFSAAEASAEADFAPRLVTELPKGLAEADYESAADSAFRRMEPEWQEHVRQIRQRTTAVESEWEQSRRRQRDFADRLAWLAPGALARAVASELVGTGEDADLAWARAIKAHALALNVALFDNRPRVNIDLSIGTGEFSFAFDRRSHWPRIGEMPHLDASEVSWGQGGAIGPAVGLVSWFVIATAAAWLTEIKFSDNRTITHHRRH